MLLNKLLWELDGSKININILFISELYMNSLNSFLLLRWLNLSEWMSERMNEYKPP